MLPRGLALALAIALTLGLGACAKPKRDTGLYEIQREPTGAVPPQHTKRLLAQDAFLDGVVLRAAASATERSRSAVNDATA